MTHQDTERAIQRLMREKEMLREALDYLLDVAEELDELVQYELGVGKYFEHDAILKSRATLKETERT
jgi:hypothetical protein